MSLERAPAVADVLAWMSEHGRRLRELVDQEQEGQRELAPGDDPTIRAHLRYAAEALAATSPAPLAGALAGFADALPEWFTECQPLYEDHLAAGPSQRSRPIRKIRIQAVMRSRKWSAASSDGSTPGRVPNWRCSSSAIAPTPAARWSS